MRKNEAAESPDNETRIPSELKFPIVGLGASAGGMEALLSFFETMPADSGMAFVVILHLSPAHESSADEILQRATRMPVLQVRELVAIQRNHVYVISPASHLSINDGHLSVTEASRPLERQIAIDLFLRELADVHKERAFAALLSGTGSDGSVGIARIKEQGGLTFAQLPSDAQFEDMPRNAIDTGAIDFVIPVADMPAKMLELCANASSIELPELDDPPSNTHAPTSAQKAEAAERALQEILLLLRTRTAHDFKHYKRATVLRRIERRMQVCGVSDMPGYRDYVNRHPAEAPALLKDMLIGVTNFFRDKGSYDALERDVIAPLFQDAGLLRNDAVRVWTAGCSTGEEAYSLAMILLEHAEQSALPNKVQVFATDIDSRAIAVARTALYPAAIITDVAPARLQKFFTKDANMFRVKKEVRDCVLFAEHNLLRDPPFSRLQMISCRNLLIYLDPLAQAEILSMFHFSLAPGGYLFLGASESIEMSEDLFTVVDKKHRIYQARDVEGRIRPKLVEHRERSYRTPESATHDFLDKRKHKPSYSEIHQRVLELYAPPSVIVNQESEIVHISDQAGRFLRYAGGEPSHSLLTLIHPELRLELRTALFQAVHSGQSVEARRVHFKHDDRSYYVNMVARPFVDEEGGGNFVLVLFDEVEKSMTPELDEPGEQVRDSVLTQLETELQAMKSQLQDMIEHAETSTEELKSSNEELQAINEELRSATEELETSKEELQSMNEELVTVNFELKNKVDETAKINDDLQNLISSSGIASIFVDRAMRVKWYTPKAATLFNLISSDVGRSLMDITHKLNYDGLAADASDTFESLRLIEREVSTVDASWYLVRVLPYRTTEDRIDGAVLTFIDITQRRLAEQRLREGQERMRLVAESTTDFAIITLDREGVITDWNRGAELIFGYRADEIIGQPGEIIFTPEDREDGVPARELRTALEQGHVSDDRWHLRKDGTRFFASGVVHPMVDGELRGYAKIARDLTEKRIQEYEQESDLVRTRTSRERQEKFFAVMSHELRHPLNLIQLNMDVLVRVPGVMASAIANRAVETVRKAVRSQSQIIEDLLDLSRVQTGKLKLTRSAVDLVEVTQGIVEAANAQAQEAGISISMEAQEKTSFVLDADSTRVEQIVWNLVSNAIKFTPTGGTVKVRLSADATMACLEVQDNGIGMKADSLSKVFDMFGQLERQHLPRAKSGLGIGLALARQLVEAHGGRIEARSPGEGQGATFVVFLPLMGASLSNTAAETKEQGRLQGLRILLVDDSRELLDALDMLFQLEGAKVSRAESGKDALALLQDHDYDLLISDIGMPGMDGYELVAALRDGPRNSRIPAVAISGYSGARIADAARQAGYTDYLCKPVSIDDLLLMNLDLPPGRPA